MMKKTRFELIEPMVDYIGEYGAVSLAFRSADDVREEVEKLGFKTDRLEIVLLNGKEYGRDFFNGMD